MTSPPALQIRAAEPSDAQAITAMVNLPNVRRGTLQMPYASNARVKRRIVENTSNHLLVGSIATDEHDDEIVAYGGLFPGARRRSHVGEVFLIVHDDHVGMGYGGLVLRALLEVADNWLGLRRLELDVNVDNSAAIHLYQRHGFEIEGTKRGDALRDGRLIDAHVMGRLRDGPVAGAS